MGYVTVGEIGRAHGVRPADITRLFYERRLRDDLCPIASGRRLIPDSYVEIVLMELRRAGKLPPLKAVQHA